MLGGGSVVTAAALLLLLAHAAAATDGCAGPTPQGHRATTARGSWRWGAACPCWDAMVEDPKLHPSTRGEACRRREERRAGRRLAGGGRAAWRPVARGRGRRARGVEAGGSQRQARAVCGSPAFYPSRM